MSRKIWLIFIGSKRDGNQKLAFCTKSKGKLKRFVISKIKDGTFEYVALCKGAPCGHYGNDNIGKEKQVEEFCFDFFCNYYGLINLRLNGGYIDFAYDGKEYPA